MVGRLDLVRELKQSLASLYDHYCAWPVDLVHLRGECCDTHVVGALPRKPVGAVSDRD